MFPRVPYKVADQTHQGRSRARQEHTIFARRRLIGVAAGRLVLTADLPKLQVRATQ